MYQHTFYPVGSEGNPGKVSVYEQQGDPEYQDSPIVMVHATGFHGRCWDEVVRQLPGRRIILIESRCHGQSSNAKPPFSWQLFSDDLVSVLNQLDLKNIIGVGHSMGGHLMVRAAGSLPDKFSHLILLDPVIMAEGMQKMRDVLGDDFEHPVAKRRDNWASSGEMFASYSKKPPFNGWHQAVLKDYCDYALTETEQGLKLASPPRLEAEIYLSTDQQGAYDAIPKVTCPVKIYRARTRTKEDSPFDFGPSTTFEGLASHFSDGEDIFLPKNSHFIPMEIPHQVAGWISEAQAGLRQ